MSILSHNAMREIRLPKVPGSLNTLYSPGILPNFKDREHLMSSQNAHIIKIRYQLSKKRKDQLYWSFIPETSRTKLPLACMRSRYKRRWNAAFIQALKNNGFDYHGRKLSSTTAAMNTSDQQPEVGLKGTLEIKLLQAVHWEDPNLSRMIEQSDKIVKGLRGLNISTDESDSRGDDQGFSLKRSGWTKAPRRNREKRG